MNPDLREQIHNHKFSNQYDELSYYDARNDLLKAIYECNCCMKMHIGIIKAERKEALTQGITERPAAHEYSKLADYYRKLQLYQDSQHTIYHQSVKAMRLFMILLDLYKKEYNDIIVKLIDMDGTLPGISSSIINRNDLFSERIYVGGSVEYKELIAQLTC